MDERELFARTTWWGSSAGGCVSSWRSAGSIFLLSVVVAAVLRDEFSVYTTILVEPQSISKKLVESGKEEQDVIYRLHLMTMQILSRARLSKVIDEFKLYPEESETNDPRGGDRHDAQPHQGRTASSPNSTPS